MLDDGKLAENSKEFILIYEFDQKSDQSLRKLISNIRYILQRILNK